MLASAKLSTDELGTNAPRAASAVRATSALLSAWSAQLCARCARTSARGPCSRSDLFLSASAAPLQIHSQVRLAREAHLAEASPPVSRFDSVPVVTPGTQADCRAGVKWGLAYREFSRRTGDRLAAEWLRRPGPAEPGELAAQGKMRTRARWRKLTRSTRKRTQRALTGANVARHVLNSASWRATDRHFL